MYVFLATDVKTFKSIETIPFEDKNSHKNIPKNGGISILYDTDGI